MPMPKEPTGLNTEEIRARNKAAVRTIIQAFNTGDPTLITEVTDPNVIDYDTCPGLELTKGPANIMMQVQMLREQFPDAHFEEELIMAEGNMVFLRWKMTGTNTGPFFGRKPTGKKITHHGHEMVLLNDQGKIVEHLDTNDVMVFTDKLGLLDNNMMQFLERIGIRKYE